MGHRRPLAVPGETEAMRMPSYLNPEEWTVEVMMTAFLLSLVVVIRERQRISRGLAWVFMEA